MQDILQEIILRKHIEVERQKAAVPLIELENRLTQAMARPVVSMRASLAASSTGIIAEFKRKSPSKGWIFPDARVEEVLPAYEKAGASACSILTDQQFFGGSLEDLSMARRLVNLPLLRKEFIIDDYQLVEARIAGADAILLIAAVLTPETCLNLARKAKELQLEVLLEIHAEKELEYLNGFIDMLGINNRNLGTFETSLEHSFGLVEKIHALKSSALLVSESGISLPTTVKELRQHGFSGFLIGETFMKGGQPGKTLSEFINGIMS
ncbi:MAG: indole-3-glycerol phosphate synthase TrpC [Prolixibacteraceae bacterium]